MAHSHSSLFSPALNAARLRLLAATEAPNTAKAYRQAWKNFTTWCGAQSVPALPADPETVATFVAGAIARGRRPATMALHLAAIAHFHREAGAPTPVDDSVRQVLHGAKRIAAPAQGKAALTAGELARALATLPESARGIRDRAILLVGFATALRRSSLAALAIEDIEFRPPGVAVRVRREKNNQTGEPRWIGVFPAAGALCPIAALAAWIQVRGPAPGALFCRLDRGRRNICTPKRLNARRIALAVQRAAALAGLDAARYGAHSLRAGFVTAATEAGVSPLVIMRTTGHRSISTLQRYFRPTSIFNVNPLAGLL